MLSPSLLRPISIFTGKVMMGGNALETRGGGSCWPKSSWRGGFPDPPRHILHYLLVRYSKNDIKKDERTSYAQPLPPVSCANNIHVHVAARNEGWWVTFKLAVSGWQGGFLNPPRRVLHSLLVRDNENDNKEDECALYAQPLLWILCQHMFTGRWWWAETPLVTRNEGWWVALAKKWSTMKVSEPSLSRFVSWVIIIMTIKGMSVPRTLGLSLVRPVPTASVCKGAVNIPRSKQGVAKREEFP